MNPLVSVIIPCYNRTQTIELCLRSVAAQTYPAIEVIVVDDASTDDSAAVAETAGATVLRLPANRGPSAARNLGAEHARGEILFFLDADVALEQGGVAAAVAALRSAPELGAICGVLGPESLCSRTMVAQYRALQMYHWWLAREGPMDGLHTALCAMRAEVFRAVGPFDPGLRHTEAPEYGRRLGQRYEVRSTAAIAGVHDHDATLRVLLPKVFRRAYASAIEWQAGEVPSGATSRVIAGGLILAAVFAWPLPLLTGAVGAVVPPLLVAAAVVLEAGTYRRVAAGRGFLFSLRFVAVHLLYQLTTAAGAAAGTARRLLAGSAWRAGAVLLPIITASLLLPGLGWLGDESGIPSLPGGDLSVYRGAVAVMLDGGSPYDFAQRGYGFVYPPFAALALTPLGLPGPAVGFWWWTVVSVFCLQGVVWLLLGRLGVGQPQHRWRLLFLATLAALPLSPVLGTLVLGNVNILLLLLVLADLLRARNRYRGILIGIAAGMKLTPLVFVPYLLLTGRIRAGVTVLVSFVGTVALGFLLLPGASTAYWGDLFLDSSRTTPPGEATFGSSIRGGWATVAPDSWEPGWLLASLAAGVVGMAIAVWASRRGAELLGIVACAVTGLLVSPVTWYTHWVWCVPVLALAATRVRRGRRPALALLGGLWLVFAVALPWWTVFALGWVDVSARSWLEPTELLYLLTGAALLVLAAAWLRRADATRPVLEPAEVAP
nr:glycosyltransferase 87 family protein [Micromonospora sp. DSM 115978]